MISVVATLYQSEAYVDEFVRRCREAASKLSQEIQIVLVDDGSPDRSLDIAASIADSADDVLVVELSRNFGHHPAMMCGLQHATGERVFLIDSDLEEDPDWVVSFSEIMDQSGADVVYGFQAHRRERGILSLGARLHYWLRRRLVHSGYPVDVTTARLMTRQYVDALLSHREVTTPILDLWVMTGFRQLGVPVSKADTSPTTYSFAARASLLISSFVLAAHKLLVVSSLIGLAAVIGAVGTGVALIVRWFAFDRPTPGWTSVIVALLFMGGAILLTVSLTGLTVSRVATEVRGRPRTIVRRLHGASLEPRAQRQFGDGPTQGAGGTLLMTEAVGRAGPKGEEG